MPDAIVLDFKLLGMTGLDAIPKIRKFTDAKIVFTSGEFGMSEFLEKHVGVLELAKPYQIRQLKEKVLEALER